MCCDFGPCPKVHTLEIADSKLHTLIEVWQRKDCTPWECAMYPLMVRNSLELCMFYKPSMKRLPILKVCDVFFYGKKFLRIMSVLYTLTEKIAHLVSKNLLTVMPVIWRPSRNDREI